MSVFELLHDSQVKVAEHILTGHKVAIKILNRKKIKQMDMEEKGAAALAARCLGARALGGSPFPEQSLASP